MMSGYEELPLLMKAILDSIPAKKREEETLAKAFASGDRALLGKTMPAKGLTLIQVDYE